MANQPYQRVSEEDNGVIAPLAGIGAGAMALHASKDRLTGMKTLYHGTSKANADKIKKEGFKASMGGIGGAGATVGDENFIKNSTGFIHATSMAPYANFYANLAGDPKIGPAMTKAFQDMNALNVTARDGAISPEMAKTMRKEISMQGAKAQLAGFLKPHSNKTSEVLKIKLPYQDYNEFFSRDEDGGANRYMAAKTSTDIDSFFVRGAKDAMPETQMIKKAFPDYIKNHKGRFGAGVALAGLGGYGVVAGTESLID